MDLEYEPRFLDEAVLRTAGKRPEGRLFYREREHVFAEPDPEVRAAAFDALSAVWAERFGIVTPIADAIAEQPLVRAGVARCAVGRAVARRDTGAEMLVRPTPDGEPAAAGRLLRLLLPPELLLEPDALRTVLRRELQHVADMLDPAFGYEPRLPPLVTGPAHERLVRDRYRVAWDVAVDGRLVRAGRLGGEARGEREAEFAVTFAMLPDIAAAFARLFDDPTPTHDSLVALVMAATRGAGRASGACGLCGFPTVEFEPDPAALPPRALAAIAETHPGWKPGEGCCRQCADLFRARELSGREAALLPGIR